MFVLLILTTFVAAMWVLLAGFTIINLLVFRRIPPATPAGPAQGWPRVAIVIPARNEERDVGRTLDAALAQDYPDFEVVIVDDRSTDGTAAEIARRSGDPRLRLVAGSEPPPSWLGKPHALASGVRAVQSVREEEGDWLLFMDADVRLAPRALADGIAYALDTGLDHLGLLPYFERRGFWEEVLMPLLASSVFIYLPSFLANLPWPKRLALGGGAFNLVRRSAYEAIGGHEKLANSVVDDIRLAIELKSAGFSGRALLGDHLVRLRMYYGWREVISGFTKNLHAVLGGGWSRGLALGLLGSLLHIGPFLWIPWILLAPEQALGVSGWMLAAALLLLLGCRAAVQFKCGYPLWPIFFHPLMYGATLAVTVTSLRMAHGHGVVRWRGREYRRDGTTF